MFDPLLWAQVPQINCRVIKVRFWRVDDLNRFAVDHIKRSPPYLVAADDLVERPRQNLGVQRPFAVNGEGLVIQRDFFRRDLAVQPDLLL